MARADRLKEEIGWLKLVVGLLVAVDASVIGWLAQNYRTADRLVMFGALIATILGTGGIVVTGFFVRRRLKELEEI